MRTRSFGPTEIEVSAVGLGCMPLSLAARPEAAHAVRVLHAALDAGVTLLDTADVYCIDDDDIGHNERLIREALASWSGEAGSVLVATKGGLRRPGGDWTRDGRPERLRQACEASLRALGLERIGVYQLHAPDPEVPFADSVGELARLRQEGKVAHVGLSNVSLSQIEEAKAIVPIVSVQNRCSPVDLAPLRQGIVARCEQDGLAFLPWSPVGGAHGKERIRREPTLARIAEARGATPFEVALAWLLGTSTAMIPIPGASRVESILSSVRATELDLSAEETADLDRAFGC